MAQINKDKIFVAIEQISLQNPITKEEAKKVITDAVIGGFHSKYDQDADLELIIDENQKIFQLFNNSKLVVADQDFVNNSESNAIELPLARAQKINPKYKVGDYVREEIDFALYSNAVMQKIKQILIQSIREQKKEIVFTKHKDLKGKMINVVVSSLTPTFVIFQLEDKTTAFMPAHLRNPKIPLAVGQNIKVYVEDVLRNSKDAQIIVSNGSKELTKKVLENEVPEVNSGIVEVIAIARQPGVRSKVAVKSNNQDIDPVGTIIGNNGNRIKSIINKLDGEKLDIIPYSDEINIFIARSFLPAIVASVLEKYDNDDNLIENQKIVIVPNNQLTLAIGRRGINAKLAVELTGIKIDVMSIKQAKDHEFDIIYNSGFSEQDIIDVESGITVNNHTSYRKKKAFDHININDSEFDNTVETFKESITESDASSSFSIDDNLFSDEDLKEMEEAFENNYNSKKDKNDSNENF